MIIHLDFSCNKSTLYTMITYPYFRCKGGAAIIYSEMKAKEIIKVSIAIPCTACRYCADDRPKHIAIPDCFAICNNLKQFGARQRIIAATYYGNLTQTYGKASNCVKCGKYEQHCPQHLPIREYLKIVASTFEPNN